MIYINDLSKDLTSTVKLFADDTSIFSVVLDINQSVNQLNNDLKKISEWAHQWKMSFNPDLSKQAQEVIFSRKSVKSSHPPVLFNKTPVARSSNQKHLGIYLDEKLNFGHHINEKIAKANKGIGVIKKLQNILPRKALLTIYKSFVRPNLDYGEIRYDQPNNDSYCNKIERIQYNAALAITGAIRGTSQSKIYKELGIESLRTRRWFRRLCTLYKIKTTGLPNYLNDLIPKVTHHYQTRNSEDLATYQTRTNLLKYSFFPYTISEWNKLSCDIRNSTYPVFRNHLLKIIRPEPDSVYNIQNNNGLKLLTRLRLGLSHLNEHRFNHNFQDCINPLCTCSLDVESTEHFFLHCHHYHEIRPKLFYSIRIIDENLLKLSDKQLTNIFLYGFFQFNEDQNRNILYSSIEYILESKRFERSLFA